MSTTSVAPRPSVLADALVARRSLASDAALVLAGVAVVALLAQVSIPLWPVPVTGQTLGVLVVGGALGARRGALSLAAYLVVGLAGLPVFADLGGGPLYVLKPSFGFIVGFVVAAFVVGRLAERDWDRRFLPALLAFTCASAIPFLFGVPYLAVVLARLGAAHDVRAVLAAGVWPFLPGGVVKAVIAAVAGPLAWRAVRTLDGRRS